ncbi:MAG: dockerin type I repeat-containing protein [Clostridia bacterium]|nr:dockerin type I repeat-containing protein [Clostridia bacterium]
MANTKNDIDLPIDPFHVLSYVSAKPATCTDSGNKAYYACSDCGKWFEDSLGTVEITDKSSVVIPASGHTPAEAVRENEVAATCCAAGSYDEVVYCSVCHEEVSREPKTIPIDEDAHDWGEWYTVTAPTCTTTGTEQRDCSNCNHSETRIAVALGHNLITHNAKAPACTEIGWDAYETCSRCDYTTYAELPATGHTETTILVNPTCTEDGYRAVHCATCYKELSHEVLSATGHDYVDGICAVCGEINFIYGDANGDGRVNGMDATSLLGYLANLDPFTGLSSKEIAYGADVNGDGKINGRDVTRLLQYLANVDPLTGESTVTLGPKK